MRLSLLRAALTYTDTVARTSATPIGPLNPGRSLTAANYTAYKKARILSGSVPSTVRPPQTAIITELQEFGCP